MASLVKTKKGFRAQVYIKGLRASATFRTKREAEAWAAAKETALRGWLAMPAGERHTLGDALIKYRAEVAPTKRGARWEEIRIAAFLRDLILPVNDPIGGVTPELLGRWRDARLISVSAGTVLREIGLLSAVLEHARREWRWIAVNPVADMRKPRPPAHRSVVITLSQIKQMLRVLGYSPRAATRSLSQSVAVAFLVALRTGMRAGELCKLTWDNVHDDFCRLPVTKTTPRDVPLEPKAMRLIAKMRGMDDVLVFGVRSQTLDVLFRKARRKAGLAGFTFHDSRHTAATWMAQRLDVLTLCKMFGWRNPNMAMVYYNPSAASIAMRLAAQGRGLSR